MGEQGGHGAAERDVQQDQLRVTRGEFRQRYQEREKELEDLREDVQLLKAAVEDTESIIIMLICSIEKRCMELIRRNRKRLDWELPHTQENIQTLYANLSASPKLGDSSKAVRNSIVGLKENLGICETELVRIFRTVENIHGEEPVMREDFLRYACHLTLDPNTVHQYLRLSEGNREVTRVNESQAYSAHKERFQHLAQVLCTEGLSGRRYWEVEWSGYMVSIAVTYKNIPRKGKGNDCRLGHNDKSWSLCCTSALHTLRHNNKRDKISIPPSSRIGVYLDHGAGILSFYSVSDTMTLLRKVPATFTQPLYPGFIVGHFGSSVEL